MPSTVQSSLWRRDSCDDIDADGDCYDDWWFSDTGLAVRYALVVVFFAIIIIFLVISYLHAQRRLKKGMPPLGYHRWLVSRRGHPRYNYPNQNGYYQGTNYGGPGQAYGMGQYPNPPPAYNTWDAPPQYQPPTGGTKALANQHLGPPGQYGEQSSAGPAPEVQPPPPAHPPTEREV